LARALEIGHHLSIFNLLSLDALNVLILSYDSLLNRILNLHHSFLALHPLLSDIGVDTDLCRLRRLDLSYDSLLNRILNLHHSFLALHPLLSDIGVDTDLCRLRRLDLSVVLVDHLLEVRHAHHVGDFCRVVERHFIDADGRLGVGGRGHGLNGDDFGGVAEFRTDAVVPFLDDSEFYLFFGGGEVLDHDAVLLSLFENGSLILLLGQLADADRFFDLQSGFFEFDPLFSDCRIYPLFLLLRGLNNSLVTRCKLLQVRENCHIGHSLWIFDVACRNAGRDLTNFDRNHGRFSEHFDVI